MTPGDIRDAVTGFLSLLERTGEAEEREEALRPALDRLALAYHSAKGAPAEEEQPEPAEVDRDALQLKLTAQFPNLGPYNLASRVAEDLGEAELAVADPVDDLVEIAAQLQDVRARFEVDEQDALFQFRVSFERYWGRHLRALQLYLHETAFLA